MNRTALRPAALRLPVLALTALLAACGGDGDGGTTPLPSRVELSPPSQTIGFIGSTVKFTARVLDGSGAPVQGVALTWASSDPEVATVDFEGRVTGLSDGTATITATTSGGVTGDAAITVEAAPCATTFDLAPGEHELVQVDCGITLPSGPAGTRYRVAIVNTNVTGSASSVTQTTLTTSRDAIVSPPRGAQNGTGGTRDAGASRETRILPDEGRTRDPLRLSPTQARQLDDAVRLFRNTVDRHVRIREQERILAAMLGPDRMVPPRAYTERMAARTGQASTDGVGLAVQGTMLPAKLQLRDNLGEAGECNSVSRPLQTAILLGQNDHLAIYQDSALNADPATQVTTEQAQRVLDYYDAYGHPTVQAYFPGMPDIDGNGKLIAFASFFQDVGQVATAAYVWGGDLLSAEQCVSSNEREITYLNADLMRSLTDPEGPSFQALGTVVHEAKHVVSFWEGFIKKGTIQPLWIEEGAAEIGGNMSSRRAWAAVGGPPANATVTGDEFRSTGVDGSGAIIPEAFGLLVRLVRAQGYLASQPNGLVVTPLGAAEDHIVYGTGWTFLRWAGDTYGNAGSSPYADASFFASQVDSATAAGLSGLEMLTGPVFQDVFTDFAVDVVLHATPGEPSGGFTSYDFVDLIETFCFAADNPPCDGQAPGPAGTWPWPVTTTSDGTMAAPWASDTFTGPIGPSGMRIYEFVSDGLGANLNITVDAAQPARVIVARIQ